MGILNGTAQEPYDVVVGVDWTAAPAVAALKKMLPGAPKLIHMNFRVFFAQDGAADAEFYETMERRACAQADRVIALTSADAAALSKLFPRAVDASHAGRTDTDTDTNTETETETDRGGVAEKTTAGLQPAVLNPPLRPDIAALARERDRERDRETERQREPSGTPPSASRRFVTLCARISEEKRVLEYVRVVVAARCVT